MKIYNTLSEKKEDLARLISGKKINMFVCGPTVYDYAHIGHARTYLFFDLVKKYLRSLGYKVFYLQNITDIDDKIIARAAKEKTSAKNLARQFEKKYYRDMKALGINGVDQYARASQHIKEVKKQIEALAKKGFAYKTDSGIYFQVKKFSDYGKLSRQNLEALRPGWRIESDSQKKDPLDFALWKLNRSKTTNPSESTNKIKINNGGPAWPSPWGRGRPGWHIEDTAITEKYLGPQYDLHGGGVDLKFPHHESEIAQQEAASGKKPLAKIWMHTGFLLVNGEKMSKSLKNFITVRDFLKMFSPSVLRLIIFLHHYRSPLNYNEKMADMARKSLDSIAQFLAKLRHSAGKKKIVLEKYELAFSAALADDFNTPQALAVIFSLINELNKDLNQLNKKTAKLIEKWLLAKLKTFQIEVKIPKIPLKIRRFAQKRELFRDNQQFIRADALRKKIEALGYKIEDAPNGPFVWPKK